MRRAVVLAFLVMAAPGCQCSDRRIDVALPGTLEVGGERAPITFTGQATDSVVGGSYSLLERVITDASSASRSNEAHTIVWTMRESDGAPAAFLSFAVRVPVATGDVVAV